MGENLRTYFKEIRKDFPILKTKVGKNNLIYVDNGATTQKPQVVIDSIVDFYQNYNSNIHRSAHFLAQKADEEYELVREKVSKFINCNPEEIVFTKGTTNSLNLVAFGLIGQIREGDEIVLTEMEHHANLVPWQEIAKRTGAVLKFIPFDDDCRLNYREAKKIINDKTKIVSITHVSNVLGTINDVKKIGKLTHNVKACFIVDGAQSIPMMKIDVKDLNVDFYTFSGHKMCGPTGVGVLYGKKDKLERLKPLEYGGAMIDDVHYSNSTYANVPYRLEAGTSNISGVIGLGVAVDYLDKIGMDKISKYKDELTKYFLDKVKDIKEVQILGSSKPKDRTSIFSLNIKGVHSSDLESIFNSEGIATRAGHHCCILLHKNQKLTGSCRISLYFYNTIEEVDRIIEVLKKAIKVFSKLK